MQAPDRHESFSLTAADRSVLQCYRWIPASPPPVTLQIVHGSLEHALRYAPFAQQLCDRGIAAYAHDLRGHGRTAQRESDLAYFSDGPDGWRRTLADVAALAQHIDRLHPTAHRVMLGHSMGSFLARSHAASDPRLSALILSGAGGGRPLLLAVGTVLAWATMHLRGRRRRSWMLHRMLYGTLNDQIENAVTPHDYLSRDTQVVQAYIEDPLCGLRSTSEYIYQFARGIALAQRRATYHATSRDLPILFISGEHDPVAGPGGKQGALRQVYDRYRAAGVRDLTLNIYPGARHEILNETNRLQVYGDVIDWMITRTGPTDAAGEG